MKFAFFIIAFLTLGSAIAAMSLRNLVHCALSMVLTFAGVAALYLQLNAQFIGFAQILVYIGAVAILIVFAVLLTRNADAKRGVRISTTSWIGGLAVSLVVMVALVGAILNSSKVSAVSSSEPRITVKEIGEQLMTKYVLPLEIVGLLLTAAMIGAVVISLKEGKSVTQVDESDLHSKNSKTPESALAAEQ